MPKFFSIFIFPLQFAKFLILDKWSKIVKGYGTKPISEAASLFRSKWKRTELKTLIYKKFITYFDQVCKLSLEHTMSCTPQMETNNNVLKSAE